jgi:hypothetical protein
MKPTKELIRDLSPAQRQVILNTRTAGKYVRYDSAGIMLLRRMVELGILVEEKSRKKGIEVSLAPGWEEVDIDVTPRKREPWVLAGDCPTVIPDPPKPKIVRPPTIYSNRSQQELIDHVLKNY